jgi:F-type H+-transporting ATPase subunit c
VNRIVQLVVLTSVVLFATAMPAMAQALTIIGAAYGIGRIGSSAVESMARQPEVAGDIRGALLLAAALIEGATFFALIVCIIAGA